MNFFHEDIVHEFGEITQNKGHCVVQGHSRSPILGTNRKLIYDFLLVININLPPILHRFRYIAFDRSKIAIFGYPSCVEIPRRRGSLCHIMVRDILLKTRFLGYISMAESLAISSTTFTHCAPEATEFRQITQNKGHYTVQGHSRSPILVPIESSCKTSY